MERSGAEEAELLDGKNPAEVDPYFGMLQKAKGRSDLDRSLFSIFGLDFFWHPSGNFHRIICPSSCSLSLLPLATGLDRVQSISI